MLLKFVHNVALDAGGGGVLETGSPMGLLLLLTYQL